MNPISGIALIATMSLALNACAQPSPPTQPTAASTPAKSLHAQSGEMQVQSIASGLEHPWAVALLPDGGFLVTERPGRLRQIAADGTVSAPLAGVPAVFAQGQGGLLDVVLDPDFADNQRIWLSYAEPGDTPETKETAGTAVATATLGDGGLSDLRVLYRQQPKLEGGNHFGSRIAFDGKGHVFISQGERNQRLLAQQLEVLQGKLVRLHLDGSIPEDNPYFRRADARGEIFSYGHRNMQGLAIDPRTGRLWQSEHGPRGGDEINLPEAGKNYGWPVITYGIDYPGPPIGEGIQQKEGMEQPVYYWDPVIAPSSLIVYRGNLFPQWQGNILIGGMNPGKLVRLQLEGDKVAGEEWLLTDLNERIRDVQQGADGSIYVVTDPGRLLRLRPAR